MKIALMGYGKMGKTIEALAIQKGHSVVYKSTANTHEGILKEAEVAIEFSTPETAVENITKCFELKIPVICGTTGWLNSLEAVKKDCKKRNASFIYASNFSIGVNLFFSLNEHLAKLMAPWDDYQVSIEEIHHTEKKDAPSGTAISLTEAIIKNSEKENWALKDEDEIEIEDRNQKKIFIKAVRKEDVKGTHRIDYSSKVDSISIKHEAHTREGFAKGAILAAEFLKDKKGIFTMKQVLGIN